MVDEPKAVVVPYETRVIGVAEMWQKKRQPVPIHANRRLTMTNADFHEMAFPKAFRVISEELREMGLGGPNNSGSVVLSHFRYR